MIKTVIFDLGGVYFTDGTAEAIEKIGAAYRLPGEKVAEVLKGELGTQYRVGSLTAEEFWERAKERWGLQVPPGELSAIWLEGYAPIAGTGELVDRLGRAGYELLFLSDNVQERVDYLESRYGFLEKFSDGVFSHVVKRRKPDPKIYELALEKASCPPEECVYIDDKPELLEPAKRLGMEAIRFESAPQLEEALRDLGLRF